MGKATKATKKDQAVLAGARLLTPEEVAQARELVKTREAGDRVDMASVYMSLSVGGLSTRRGVSLEEGVAGDSGADESLLHLAKDILEAKELQEIDRLRGEMRRWLWTHGYPSKIRKGVYVLPLALVAPAVAFFEKKETELLALVEALVERYPAIKAEAKKKLGTLYAEGDYPSPAALRGVFYVSYSFIALEVPGTLTTISKDLYARERQKALQRAEEERVAVVQALRVQFLELADHMAEMLTPGVDGKPRRFKESTLDNAREFFALFSARNIGGDATLEPLIQKANLLLAGVDAATLKKTPDLQKSIQAGFAQVKATLAEFVQIKPSRAIRLAD